LRPAKIGVSYSGKSFGEIVSGHQIRAGQELVGGVDAIEVLALDLHEVGQSGAGADENGIEAHIGHQLINCVEFADDITGLDLDAHLLEIIDFGCHNCLGQTKFRDTVSQDTARFMERLEDGDFVAEKGEVGRDGQPGRAGADDGDFLAGRWSQFGNHGSAMFSFPVGHESFKIADGDRSVFFGENTDLLALFFLRADTAANGGQGIGLFDLSGRPREITFHNQGNKSGDIDLDRTAGYAHRFLAFETSRGFDLGQFRGEPMGDFLKISDPLFRFLFGHRLPINSQPFFLFQGFFFLVFRHVIIQVYCFVFLTCRPRLHFSSSRNFS